MFPHHIRLDLCKERPKYRQGRKLTAVKVYTVADESQYLLIQGVPSLGISDELHAKCSSYGKVSALSILEDYPSEQFTKTYLLKYENINSARYAKKRLDDLEFYGGVLHVCYAPEYESLDETRSKLQERRITISKKCAKNEAQQQTGTSSESHKFQTQSRKFAQPRTYKQPLITAQSSHLTQSNGNQCVQHTPHISSHIVDSVNTFHIEPVSIAGLNNVTTTNIDRIELESFPSHKEEASRTLKRKHSATEAGCWSSTTFKLESVEHNTVKSVSTSTTEAQSTVGQTSSRVLSKGQMHNQQSKPQYAAFIGKSYQPELSNCPKIVVRQSDKTVKSEPPRFVPRQLGNQMKAAAVEAQKIVVANATKLGKVQEATLPTAVETAIRNHNKQVIADKTTLEIRKKVNQIT